MSSDWQTFLKNIAVAKCLTPEQTETLLQKFPSPHETNTQTKVGMELGIEGSSVQARLAEIYTKFEISGKGTKTQKLQTILQTEFHQSSQPQVAEATTAAISLEQMKRACYDLLERQKRLNTNSLMAKDGIEFKPDDLFVPLGLVERRNRPRRQDIESSDQGSQLYGVTEEEVTQTFKHRDFFEQVIRDGSTPKSRGQRLAITGEPGAGKTTLLQRIGDWLREHEQVPVWISLANVGTKPLREYLLEDWLRDAAGATDAASPDWQATLEQLLKAGQVCLLLDGVDEMTIPQALRWIGEQLGEGWAASVRVVLTCRLNVWESAALPGFDVYRNLDFDYPDQVEQFIDQFFQREGAEPALGQALKEELEKSGKERIRDSVKNPLRLSLLCYTWELGDGELPDTKAELYRHFVEAFYTLKQREFPISPDEQETLNQALGDLAREAIDQNESRFRLRESFIQKFLGHPYQEGSLFCQARRLGWLNEIGVTSDKPHERAYTFLHTTFQEYFAALVIHDCDFFLKHCPQNPNRGIYRIFDSAWREISLIWMGRKDVSSLNKEKLILELEDFEDGCGAHFWTKAIFIAANLIDEFPKVSSEISNRIIDDLLEWAIGYWDSDEGEWYYSEGFAEENSKRNLPLSFKDEIIRYLLYCISKANEDWIVFPAAQELAKIDPKHQKCLDLVLKAFKLKDNQDPENEARCFAIDLAQEIDPNHPILINEILLILESLELDSNVECQRHFISNCIALIDPGNTLAVQILEGNLKKVTHNEKHSSEIATCLLMIDPENEIAISILLKLILNSKDQRIINYSSCELAEWISKEDSDLIEPVLQALKKQRGDLMDVEIASLTARIDQDLDQRFNLLERIILVSEKDENARKAAWEIINITNLEKLNYIPSFAVCDKVTRKFIRDLISDRYFLNQVNTLLPPSEWFSDSQLNALSDLLLQLENHYSLFLATKALLSAKPEDFLAVSCLVNLFRDCHNPDLHWDISMLLLEHLPGNELLSLARNLQTDIEREGLQEKYRWKIIHYEEVICYCSENLSYIDFYRMFHGARDSRLENEVSSTAFQSLKMQSGVLLPANILDVKRMKQNLFDRGILLALHIHEEQSESTISKRISNRIFLEASVVEGIPKVKDIGDLEEAILHLKMVMDNQNLAILFHDTQPYANVVSVCYQISDIVHIGWITDQPIACNTIRTFHPDSTDLLSAIQSWLDEISL